MNQGRILGLDAGERRIGVAISDPGRSFALPLESVTVDGRELEAIAGIVRNEAIEAIVIGLPLSLSGEDSDQTQRARDFAERAGQALGVEVHLVDERLSSSQAEGMVADRGSRRGRGRDTRKQRGGQGADTDAIAASIILQAYLDRLRFEPTRQD
jgi:putative holliday junction resolvase